MSASRAWEKFQKSANSEPFLISTLINQSAPATTLIDTGCTSYGLISSQFARKHNLARITVEPRAVVGFDQRQSKPISEVAKFSLDVGGYEREVFLYIVPKLGEYDLILGLPWMKAYNVRIWPKRCSIRIRTKRISIRNERTRAGSPFQYIAISAAAFHSYLYSKETEVFSASLADI